MTTMTERQVLLLLASIKALEDVYSQAAGDILDLYPELESGAPDDLTIPEELAAVRDLVTDQVKAMAQVNRLAEHIMFRVPGEPSKSEGAIDCAIRLLSDIRDVWHEGSGSFYRAAVIKPISRQEAFGDLHPEPVEAREQFLEAFIQRAGFSYGWKNLESWARRMAEQAYDDWAKKTFAQPMKGDHDAPASPPPASSV